MCDSTLINYYLFYTTGAVLVASQFNEVDGTLIKVAKESNKNIDFLYIGTQALSGPRKLSGKILNLYVFYVYLLQQSTT